MLHINAEFFHKIKFCCTSKNVEHEHDFNTYVLLDSHSSNIYSIFFQAKALMTSQVNTWKKTLLLSTSNVHSLIIATIAIHLFLKRLWIGKNVPCTQNCNLLFIEQLNPYNYLYSQNFNNFALVYHWVQSFCAESMGISPHCFGSGSVIVSAHFGLRCLRSAKSFRFPCRLS